MRILWLIGIGLGLSVAWAEAQVVEYPGPVRIVHHGLDRTAQPPMLKVQVNDRYFWVMEGVIPPSEHSAHLLAHTNIQAGESVLDLGTGCGVQAVFAARTAARVVATDIDPKAVENARYNVRRHGVDHIVTVRQGDLFVPVAGERFDVILFSVAYAYNAQTQHLWALHERFFREVGRHLRPGGRIYYQNGYIRNLARVKALAEANGLRVQRVDMVFLSRIHRAPAVFEITRAGDEAGHGDG